MGENKLKACRYKKELPSRYKIMSWCKSAWQSLDTLLLQTRRERPVVFHWRKPGTPNKERRPGLFSSLDHNIYRLFSSRCSALASCSKKKHLPHKMSNLRYGKDRNPTPTSFLPAGIEKFSLRLPGYDSLPSSWSTAFTLWVFILHNYRSQPAATGKILFQSTVSTTFAINSLALRAFFSCLAQRHVCRLTTLRIFVLVHARTEQLATNGYYNIQFRLFYADVGDSVWTETAAHRTAEFTPEMGNLFIIRGRTNCALSLVGRKINYILKFYLYLTMMKSVFSWFAI